MSSAVRQLIVGIVDAVEDGDDPRARRLLDCIAQVAEPQALWELRDRLDRGVAAPHGARGLDVLHPAANGRVVSAGGDPLSASGFALVRGVGRGRWLVRAVGGWGLLAGG